MMMLRRSLIALLPLLAGCYTGPPPGIDDSDLARLEADGGLVRLGDVRIYFPPTEVSRERAERLAPDVEAIRRHVGERLGTSPPRMQLVVYEPSGPPGAAGPLVDRVLCVFIEGDYTIRFRYPLEDEDALARTQLLGTVAHEVGEATLLGRVTTGDGTLDPYLRWMHDGVAELVEHEALRDRAPEDARLLLERTLRFIEDRRAEGVEWVDLTRWRQLGDDVVRAQRLLLDGQGRLPLADAPAAIARLRRAREAVTSERDAWRREALVELEAVLEEAGTRAALPWREGEGRTDDAEALDYIFYNTAFTLWLRAERAAPGTLRRFMAGLGARRDGGDHVLAGAEAEALLQEAAGAAGEALPPLDRVPLAWVEEGLRAEERRLSGP
jgi:hypothetical protein